MFGSGSQASVQQRLHGQSMQGSNVQPRVQGQVFALNQDQVAEENERVIACIFILCSIHFYFFIDTDASYLFILYVLLSIISYHMFP